MASRFFSSLRNPAKESHKGQNGKLFVISGSAKYSGCSIFNLLAARRFVDLLYFYPGERDSFLISAVKTIPEAIVVNDFDKLAHADCVLFGGGMENLDFDYSCLGEAKKIVVDASGFNFLKPNMLDSRFILTPHILEFERFFSIPANDENVLTMAKEHDCVILKKGTPDLIAGREMVYRNDMHNAGMTKGGTGDVLAGLVAALACTNPNFDAAVAGACINGMAGNMLFNKFGYNYCATDLADALSLAYAEATSAKKKGRKR